MTDEQYAVITKNLKATIDNQIKLANKIDALQSDVSTIINNQLITGKDQDKLIKDVAEIKKAITKL